MKIHINGQLIELTSITNSLADALTLYLSSENAQQSFAVALNGEFVGRPDYGSTDLRAGDSVDVLFPIQGG